jgi:hypothetical protein
LAAALLAGTFAPVSASVAAEVYTPRPEALNGLCPEVADRELGDMRFGRRYIYERMILDAAGLRATLPPGVAVPDPPDKLSQDELRHLQGWWLSELRKPKGGKIQCENGMFGSSKSVLKYALKMRIFFFITRAMRDWHLEPNAVDASDCRTLLDYAEIEMEKYVGTDDYSNLRNIVSFIRDRGGKRAQELDLNSLIITGDTSRDPCRKELSKR